jgi:hypothetical protein
MENEIREGIHKFLVVHCKKIYRHRRFVLSLEALNKLRVLPINQ